MSWSGYKKHLLEGLNKCIERFSPDLVLYVAGVDIHANDKLGRLSIDDEGLFEREMTVLIRPMKVRFKLIMRSQKQKMKLMQKQNF